MLRGRRWILHPHAIALTYTIDGTPFALPDGAEQELEQVRQELASLEADITAQQQEAARYSGGLVQALALSTLATLRQTHAMLDQKRLALQYGLPQYVTLASEEPLPMPGTATPATGVAPTATSSPTPTVAATPTAHPLSFVEITYRVTERNNVWWRFAWRLTVRNSGDTIERFDAIIEFQDADGFVIDTDHEYDLAVGPNSEHTFTGSALIDADVAQDVAQVYVKGR